MSKKTKGYLISTTVVATLAAGAFGIGAAHADQQPATTTTKTIKAFSVPASTTGTADSLGSSSSSSSAASSNQVSASSSSSSSSTKAASSSSSTATTSPAVSASSKSLKIAQSAVASSDQGTLFTGQPVGRADAQINATLTYTFQGVKHTLQVAVPDDATYFIVQYWVNLGDHNLIQDFNFYGTKQQIIDQLSSKTLDFPDGTTHFELISNKQSFGDYGLNGYQVGVFKSTYENQTKADPIALPADVTSVNIYKYSDRYGYQARLYRLTGTASSIADQINSLPAFAFTNSDDGYYVSTNSKTDTKDFSRKFDNQEPSPINLRWAMISGISNPTISVPAGALSVSIDQSRPEQLGASQDLITKYTAKTNENLVSFLQYFPYHNWRQKADTGISFTFTMPDGTTQTVSAH